VRWFAKGESWNPASFNDCDLILPVMEECLEEGLQDEGMEECLLYSLEGERPGGWL
jgi:hypothetical protein